MPRSAGGSCQVRGSRRRGARWPGDRLAQEAHARHTTALLDRLAVRQTLFWKYVVLFVAVTSAALIINGLVDIWFTVRDHRAALFRIQKEQADLRGLQDHPVHQGDRGSARLDHPPVLGDCGDRAARTRRPQAAAPGSGDRRAGLARRRGPRAVAHFAAGHGRGRQQYRFLDGRQVQGGARQQGLLRARLFPARHRAVHDAGDGRRAPRCRRQRGRGQPHAHLGRRQSDQGRPQRPRLCRRCARAAHRPSRDQPRAAQYRLLAACPGQVGTRARAGARHRGSADCARSPRRARAGRARHGGAAQLARVRRAARERGQCAALHGDPAHRRRPGGRPRCWRCSLRSCLRA